MMEPVAQGSEYFDIKAVIKTKQEVAKSTLLAEFDLLGEKVAFLPGQHFHVIFPNGLKHHFTIANSPTRIGILSFITRIRDSAFKQELMRLPVGTEVLVGKIKGEFTLPENIAIPMVWIALGIGITPYLSMLEFLNAKGLSYTVTLLYSDSDVTSMVHKEELENFAKDHSQFHLVETITKDPSWQGEHSHIDSAFIKKYIQEPEKFLYYVSGPPEAVHQVAQAVKSIGVSEDHIKTEDFTGY